MEADSIYLEDDFSRETFFPRSNGLYPTALMMNRGSFTVNGYSTGAAVSVPQPSTSTTMPVPSMAPYGTQRPTATRSSTQTANPAFVNPQKKTRTTRKQICVADVEDNGKINAYNAVYISIQDGTGVTAVATSVKEYLNSADDYTLCDSKGLPIADTSETKDLDFWKISSRKVYAIKAEDLVKLNRPDQAHKRRRTEVPEITVVERLRDMEETLKMKIRSSLSINNSDVEQSTTEVIQLLSQVKSAVSEIGRKVDVLDVMYEKVADVTANTCVSTALRQAFMCKICMGIPRSVVVVTTCCGQAIGCGECIAAHLSDNDSCPLCKAGEFVTKIVHLKGFEEILKKIT